MCLLGNGVVPKTAGRAEHGSGLCASCGRTGQETGAGSPSGTGDAKREAVTAIERIEQMCQSRR